MSNIKYNVALTMDQWDFLTSVMDMCHTDAEINIKNLKKSKNIDIKKSIILEKEYANNLNEIMNEIADCLVDITVKMEYQNEAAALG